MQGNVNKKLRVNSTARELIGSLVNSLIDLADPWNVEGKDISLVERAEEFLRNTEDRGPQKRVVFGGTEAWGIRGAQLTEALPVSKTIQPSEVL
jgi:hypothetical protein